MSANDPLSTELGELGEERLGPFVLLGRLGQGGMGAVFRARDERSGEVVALKVLKGAGQDPSLLERFEREGRLLAGLDHPGIVGLRSGLEVSEGQAYYAMELVEGQDLRQVLRTRGALSAEEAVGIAKEVLAALSYAHARGVIHRDVKPPNVLMNSAGRARLADFGLARALESSGLTRTGTVLGTPEYMAPEQAEGNPSEARTDLYAVGVLLFELVSGAPPFRAERPLAVLRAHCEAPVPPLRAPHGLPAGLEGVVRRALAKAPADRWPSAEAMVDALSELSFADLTSAEGETTIEGPPGAAGLTTPLPQLRESGRGSVGAAPISAEAMHAETTLDSPPASAAVGGISPRLRGLALFAVVVIGALGVWGGLVARDRTLGPPLTPAPSRGLERDWGSLPSPGVGTSESYAAEQMRSAAWAAEERGAWEEAAVIWAGASLRQEDSFDRLSARGRALQAIAAVGSPGLVVRALGDSRVLALSPDGGLAAQVLKSGGILLTPLVGPTRHLGDTPELNQLKFSRDGRYLAAAPWFNGKRPRPIEVWDLRTDSRVARLTDGEHATRWFAWSPSGAWIASGSASPEDGLLLWDPSGERGPLRCPGNDMRIHVQPAWSPAGTTLMFSSSRGGFAGLASGLTLIPFDPLKGRFGRVRTVERGHSIAAAAWSPDGALLALGGDGDPVDKKSEWPRVAQGAVLNLKTGRSSQLTGHRGGLTGFSWSPDGSRLVSSDQFGLLQCWRVSSEGKVTLEGMQGEIATPRPEVATATPLAWTPDSAYLVGAGTGSGIAVWSGRERRLQALLPPDEGSPLALRWISAGVLAVLTNKELSARSIPLELFDLSPGELLELGEERAGRSVGSFFPRAKPKPRRVR
ncbi:MAG: protein kinase [Planctomycetes bacterium]|nr:protein kinase [Planctomycetota bacterium]